MQIFKLFFKNKKGEKVEYDIGADAINIQENSTHRFITDVERQQWNAKLEEKDLGAAAKYAVANNDTTTAPGFLADARVVKQHGDEIDQINSDLAGYKFGTTSDGKPGYIMPGGADTVIPFKSHTIFDASVSVGSSDASSVTVPLTKYYPNYSKITAANIFVKYKNGTLMGYAKTGGSSFSSVLGLSYNNSTGNLTISNAGNNTAGGFYYYRGSTQVFTICIVP